ncbi:hypothetical protein CLV62_104159 [Dysgonomonas alginatilytica]|uniref:Uncharacterized protein n=1 Tax=Dysgonomonas alginatilytica TaxID=1605892 RepID=A0A2V3PTR7_9BACT|nr:hypothetical protein [Dysgonomonas alginatilytica]PXV66898.1 hypothetical protein CLV62_104159 [Dysgonomonas alginatilytica]
MKDNRQQKQSTPSSEEISIPKYIEMKFNDKQSITIGKNEEGKFLLHVGDSKMTELYNTLLISEEHFLCLIASTIIYFEHYEINMMEKIREIIGTESITYKYPLTAPEKE